MLENPELLFATRLYTSLSVLRMAILKLKVLRVLALNLRTVVKVLEFKGRVALELTARRLSDQRLHNAYSHMAAAQCLLS